MILDNQYGLGGNGLPGNDDYATMSAWFIWAALGLYPLPSTETYILGSPVISSARIYRRMGNNTLLAFNINAAENRPWKHEVESVNLGGRPLDRFVTHSMLSQSNSILNFVMG
jgi:putative alpha-1,2-mannosidase